MVKNNKKVHLKKINISAIVIYSSDCETIPAQKELFEKAKKSVLWCDELILINGIKGSFNDWRNKGLKKAKGDWVLYLDSDEEITKELKDEILLLIGSDQSNGCFAIPRHNFIFGKKFKYSGQYPDYQIRLFLRNSLKKWVNIVHEQPKYLGKLSYIKNPIVHHKNMSISQMIEKTNKWSEMEADLMFKANHPPMNIFRFASAGLREFWKRFFKEICFMDGKEGIIYGIYQIYSRLISYAKLWEKQLSITHT